MGAHEFAEWQVMYANEQLHPSTLQARHGQLLAAIYTGTAAPPRGERGHKATHFIAADPWRASATPRRVLTAREIATQVAAFNANHKR